MKPANENDGKINKPLIMNYSMKLFLLFALFFASIFSSCTEDSDLKSVSTVEKQDIDSSTNDGPGLIPFSCEEEFKNLEVEFNDNPYDYIGVLHNQGIDYHALNLPSGVWDNFGAEDLSEILRETNVFSIAQGNTELDDRYLERMEIDIWNDINGTLITDVYLENGQISQELYSIFNQINNQLNGDYQIGNLDHVQEILNNLKSVETKILLNTSLSSDEKMAALSSAATARYSIVYWTCQFLSNEFFANLFQQEDSGARWPCWDFFVSMASSDARNALIGGAGGLLLGPGGAAAGAFVSGVAGSVGTAISDAAQNGPCN